MITFSPVAVLSRVNAPPEPVSETVNTNCPLGSLAIMSFSPGTVAAPPPSTGSRRPSTSTVSGVVIRPGTRLTVPTNSATKAVAGRE